MSLVFAKSIAAGFLGPASSADNHFLRFDGTTGHLGQVCPGAFIDDVGGSIFQNSTDSTTAYQWLDADGGTPVLNIDTTNERVGVGVAAPLSKLQVSEGTDVGTDWASNGEVFTITGEDIQFSFVDTDHGTWGAAFALKQVDGTVFENAWGMIRQTNGNGSGDGSLRFTYGSNVNAYNNPSKMTIHTSGKVGINESSPETLLEMTSTAPYFTFHNSTEENDADKRESKLIFKGEKLDTAEHTMCIQIVAKDGSADDQKAYISWALNAGADGDSPTEVMRVLSSSYVGINETAPDAQTEIKSSAAGTTILHLKAAASPTAHLFNITDSSDASLVRVTSGGKIQGEVGIRTSANDWGDGLSTWPYGLFVAEHTITDNEGNFDATGNAEGEAYFYDTTNSPFTQADADNRNWINITSGTFKGAKAEIIEYISADGVLIHAHGSCWDEDLSSVNFKIYPAPQFITSDCFDTHLHVGTEGQFHVENSGGLYTGHAGMCMDFEIGADDVDVFHIHAHAGGYNNVDAMQIFYETGDLQAGDQSQIIQVTVDETGATGGEVDCIYLETTDAVAGVSKHGIHVGTGFDVAMEVSGGSAIDPDYGYEVAVDHTATDRITEFTAAANDVEILDLVNQYIVIGNDDIFEVLESVFAVVSSKDCVLEFYYSTGDGTWGALVVNDGTQGFTKSGQINWTDPGDWAETSHADGGDGAITEGYYIKIKRTYAPVIPTLPTESYFKIYLEQGGDTGMQILGDGSIKLPYLTGAPANLTNGRCWMESDGLHIYYGGAEKLVAGA